MQEKEITRRRQSKNNRSKNPKKQRWNGWKKERKRRKNMGKSLRSTWKIKKTSPWTEPST